MKEIEKSAEEHYAQNQDLIKEDRQGEVVKEYYSLPKEPSKGTTFAIQLNGKRIIRKFEFRMGC